MKSDPVKMVRAAALLVLEGRVEEAVKMLYEASRLLLPNEARQLRYHVATIEQAVRKSKTEDIAFFVASLVPWAEAMAPVIRDYYYSLPPPLRRVAAEAAATAAVHLEDEKLLQDALATSNPNVVLIAGDYYIERWLNEGKKEHFDLAIQYYQKANCTLCLARAYALAGRFDEAEKALSRADHPLARAYLAVLRGEEPPEEGVEEKVVELAKLVVNRQGRYRRQEDFLDAVYNAVLDVYKGRYSRLEEALPWEYFTSQVLSLLDRGRVREAVVMLFFLAVNPRFF